MDPLALEPLVIPTPMSDYSGWSSGPALRTPQIEVSASRVFRRVVELSLLLAAVSFVLR